MTTNIEDRRTRLRTWLLKSGMSRPQLAKKLNVSLASVNNWLSCTNIPEKRWQDIAALFEPEQPERKRIVGSSFSDEEVALIKKAAGDMPIEEFVRKTLLSKIKKDIGDE